MTDASKPASGKTSKRLNAAGKLTALLGLPVVLIGGIFAGGLYVGATRSYRIQTLEARYLGLEDPGGATWTPPSARKAAAESGPAPGEPSEPSEPEPEPEPNPPEATSGGAVEPPPGPGPAPEPTPPEPTPPAPTPIAVEGLVAATAAPVGVELRPQFDAPLVIHVKLLVDPALAAAREDWLVYAGELFSATKESFDVLFGIELRLQGVVLWEAARGSEAAELLAELETHEREGAELVLGLVAGAAPPGYTAPAWTSEVHGDHGLVFADLKREDRYYQNMLRALTELLGAQPTSAAAATQMGSFMSPGGSPEGQAPVLDPATRGQVLIHKTRPFVSRESEPEPEPGTEGEN